MAFHPFLFTILKLTAIFEQLLAQQNVQIQCANAFPLVWNNLYENLTVIVQKL
jgi:hypothetical protein